MYDNKKGFVTVLTENFDKAVISAFLSNPF